MTTRRIIWFFALTAGCTGGAGEPLEPLPGSGIVASEEEYPEGDVGTMVGSVIQNYVFDGYVDASQGTGAAFEVTFSMGDFYNPSGEGVYGAGDVFREGQPKPKALMINVSANWCGPCQDEARETLPEKYALYRDQGFEVLLVLADSDPGVTAEFEHLDIWCESFDVNYPAAIDPMRQLGSLFMQDQFPANFIIDTRTMTIAEVLGGRPQDGFWQKLEAVLGGG